MGNLKDRTSKLESAVTWRWFDRVLEMNDALSADIIYLLVDLEILKKPRADMWKRVEMLRSSDLLQMTPQELKESLESHADVTTAHTSIMIYCVFVDAPKECRAVGSEAQVLGLIRKWLEEVWPQLSEWSLSEVKQMLDGAISREYPEGPSAQVCYEFLEGRIS